MRKNQQRHQQELQNHLEEDTYAQTLTNVRDKGARAFAKYSIIVGLSFIISDVFAEQMTYPVGNLARMYFAYFAVPFLIFSIFVAVYVYSYRFVKLAWRNSKIKLLSVLAGIGYALFYIFTTNIISTPDVPMPPNSQGFLLPLQVYGQMTMWPDVEFWSPALNLFGYFSVGNILVVYSLTTLTMFSVALLAHNIKRKFGKQSTVPFGGAFLASLSTNACCCCTP
jgi:hypothetical protein